MIRKYFAGAVALAAMTCALSSVSAGNLAVKDANGVVQALCEKSATDGSLVACHVMMDTTMTQIDPATKQLQQSELSAISLTTPSTMFAAITPSDSVALATQPKALFIGAGGNLTVKGSDGVSATFVVATGEIMPIRPNYVMATGTTATGIVALN